MADSPEGAGVMRFGIFFISSLFIYFDNNYLLFNCFLNFKLLIIFWYHLHGINNWLCGVVFLPHQQTNKKIDRFGWQGPN